MRHALLIRHPHPTPTGPPRFPHSLRCPANKSNVSVNILVVPGKSGSSTFLSKGSAASKCIFWMCSIPRIWPVTRITTSASGTCRTLFWTLCSVFYLAGCLLWLSIRLLQSTSWEWLFKKSLKTGLYYEVVYEGQKKKYKINVCIYFTQLFVWLLIIFISKIFTSVLIYVGKDFFYTVCEIFVIPFDFNEDLELSMVLIFYPIILNAFYVGL